jgi:hypothetical protein
LFAREALHTTAARADRQEDRAAKLHHRPAGGLARPSALAKVDAAAAGQEPAPLLLPVAAVVGTWCCPAGVSLWRGVAWLQGQGRVKVGVQVLLVQQREVVRRGQQRKDPWVARLAKLVPGVALRRAGGDGGGGGESTRRRHAQLSLEASVASVRR